MMSSRIQTTCWKEPRRKDSWRCMVGHLTWRLTYLKSGSLLQGTCPPLNLWTCLNAGVFLTSRLRIRVACALSDVLENNKATAGIVSCSWATFVSVLALLRCGNITYEITSNHQAGADNMPVYLESRLPLLAYRLGWSCSRQSMISAFLHVVYIRAKPVWGHSCVYGRSQFGVIRACRRGSRFPNVLYGASYADLWVSLHYSSLFVNLLQMPGCGRQVLQSGSCFSLCRNATMKNIRAILPIQQSW